MPRSIIIHDSTLRDGNHAVKHQLTINNIQRYCAAAEAAGAVETAPRFATTQPGPGAPRDPLLQARRGN